jgi:hypothetical protein
MSTDHGPSRWAPLTRHFMHSQLDLGFLSQEGADGAGRVVMGAIAGIVAFGLLLARVFVARSSRMPPREFDGAHPLATLGDDMFVLALPLMSVALVTTLIARSLFPSEIDHRVLTVLPVTRSLIFRAKGAALALLIGLFAVTATVSFTPAYVLASVGGAPSARPLGLLAFILVPASAACFGALAVISLVGLVTVLVPRRHTEVATGLAQTALLCALVLAIPAGARLFQSQSMLGSPGPPLFALPPAWFTGLALVMRGSTETTFINLALTAVGAVVGCSACVGICYAVLYHRFDCLLERPQAKPLSAWRRLRSGLEAYRGRTRRGAIWRFTTTTLRRSPLHRGVYLGGPGLGVGIALVLLGTAGVESWIRHGGEPASRLAVALVFAPFVLIYATTMALRASLLLPMDRNANWIFRMMDDPSTRRQHLAALERAFLAFGLAPSLLVMLPLQWSWLGVTAFRAAAVEGLWGMLLIELVLSDWNRLPFACSYLPGKRFFVETCVRSGSALVFWILIGAILQATAIADARAAAAHLCVLLLGVAWLRRERRQHWANRPLLFEDQQPDIPQTLDLQSY